MPRVLVPYVRLHPATVAALHRDGVDPEFVDTSGSPSAYWHCLARTWARGRSFIVLEQDKVPEPGLLQAIWECGFDWCSVPTPMQGTDQPAPYASLSCTKFAAPLIAANPDLMLDVGTIDLGFGEKEWSRLDLGIHALLPGEVHYHQGVVEHLHEPASRLAQT
jgi:hypothetical protein